MNYIKLNLYQRNGVWWVYFRQNGKRIRKSLQTKNERVAQRKLVKLERELITKPDQSAFLKQILLEEFWKGYLDFASLEKRPRTIRLEISCWSRFIKWLHDHRIKYIHQIDSKTYLLFRKNLSEKGLKNSSINISQRHLKSILSYAERNNYIKNHPIKGIKLLKVEEKPPRFLNASEINRVLVAAKEYGYQMEKVFALGIYAGFRRNEIAHSRWDWFDFDKNIITIHHHGDFVPKNHRMRPIPLNEKLKKILLQDGQKESGYIFKTKVAEERRVNYIRYDFKKAFDKVKKTAGVEWITPHILRHTFASHLALAGVSLYKIQQWLGHSDPKTTMIYAHLQAHDEDINLI